MNARRFADRRHLPGAPNAFEAAKLNPFIRSPSPSHNRERRVGAAASIRFTRTIWRCGKVALIAWVGSMIGLCCARAIVGDTAVTLPITYERGADLDSSF